MGVYYGDLCARCSRPSSRSVCRSCVRQLSARAGGVASPVRGTGGRDGSFAGTRPAPGDLSIAERLTGLLAMPGAWYRRHASGLVGQSVTRDRSRLVPDASPLPGPGRTH